VLVLLPESVKVNEPGSLIPTDEKLDLSAVLGMPLMESSPSHRLGVKSTDVLVRS
jgi:hypothetical protein